MEMDSGTRSERGGLSLLAHASAEVEACLSSLTVPGLGSVSIFHTATLWLPAGGLGVAWSLLQCVQIKYSDECVCVCVRVRFVFVCVLVCCWMVCVFVACS